MCHDDDSRPPAPPTTHPVASAARTTLTAADGNVLAAYVTEPGVPSTAGVVILPDVRGLHPYYEALAERFAEAGFHAVALDYFGRTAGTGPRGDDFDWQAQIGTLTPGVVAADAAAAVAHLRERGATSLFSVGFCFGGGQSWRLSASDLGLAGCIGFYGRPAMLADVEADLRAPLLLLVAGADAATPLADFEAIQQRLRGLGKDVDMVVYEGAPHSFFDRAFREWRDACADAWQQILDFTARHG